MSDDILERKVIHPGKAFIKEGEEHARAYIIQNGLVRSYIMKDMEKIEVMQYGPGRIIGEVCLMSDEPMTMNYEALVDTTVVSVTRQDFQRKIAKMDKNVSQILEHVMNKLNYQYAQDVNMAMEKVEITGEAAALVDSFLGNMSGERKDKYQRAILPYVNGILREMRNLRAEEKK